MEENLDRKPHVYRGWKTDLCPLSTVVVSAGGIGTLSSGWRCRDGYKSLL